MSVESQLTAMATSDSSPQSKRHSFPAILTYSETLSVLSEHQSKYNHKELSRGSNTPTILANGSEEDRRQKLQEAMEWLKQELKDMCHQDKFLLRQFNHLNRSIQDLKDKHETPEESVKREQQEQVNAKQSTNEAMKQRKMKKEQPKKPWKQESKSDGLKQAKVQETQQNKKLLTTEFKLESLKEAQIKQAQRRRDQVKQELKLEEAKQEKRSLTEYDSDYGSESSDQSMDKFEDDCQSMKNIILNASPKTTQKQRTNKRWTWWK